MNIRKSEPESTNYGLDIYRAEDYLESLDTDKFIKTVYKERPDLVKLKLSTLDADLYSKLSQLPFFVDIHSLQFRNSTKIKGQDKEFTLPDHLSYRVATLSDVSNLRPVLEEVLSNSTDKKFKQRINYFSRTQYIENTVEYLLSFLEDSNKEIWVVVMSNEIVAFFSGIFLSDVFEGVMYGVRPKFRGLGISNHIYFVMKGICSERGARFFVNDIIRENWGSLKSAEKVGMIGKEYLHVNVYTFLSNRGELIEELDDEGDAGSKADSVEELQATEIVFSYLSSSRPSQLLKTYKWSFDNVIISNALRFAGNTLVGHRFRMSFKT